MMKMYTTKQIHQLQTDEDFFNRENEKYCLVSLEGKEITKEDVENHCNFCILTIITHYKRGFIKGFQANMLIDTLDTYEYSTDLLGPEKVIDKINREIVSRKLNTPHFNHLCVKCDDLYDFD